MYYQNTSSKQFPWTIHSIHRTCFPSKNDPWPMRLSSTCHPCHPLRSPPPTTCHGTPRTIQRATAKGMTTQRTITTTTSQTHLWFIQSRGVLFFFVAVFFWKIVGPCKFSTYNLKTNFGDQLILWKSIKSLPFKNTFFWCHSTGTSHLKQFPQKTLHKTHIYSPENEQLEPENHPYKKETHLTKRNLYSCGFKMLAFRGCVLDVAGTSLCTARFKGSKATTAALLKEGNEGHQERFLKASPSGVGCGYSAGFHTGKNHRFLVGSPFWIHWFHMKNGKILYQQSQIQKWPKNGDVLWRSNIANKKPHPRRFSNIYSLLKVCWGNGNLNQLENFIVIFLALLCDLAWMVEWPLLKGCWWTTQPFGDTKGSRIESPGIHLRNSAIQLEGLSYFLICFLFVFGLFCWSCMSCCVIF